MKFSRVILMAFGVALLLLGAVVMGQNLQPDKIVGVGSWFLYAIIAHDGVIAAVTFGTAFLLRRAGRALPTAVLAIIQSGLVICAIFAIIVLPEIYKQFLGSKNATVLALNYGPSLIVLWAIVIALTALAVVAYYAFARRQKKRSSISQA